MASMTLLTQPVAMATTQLARVIRYEVSAPWQEHASGRQPLRLNWVVAAGKKWQPHARHAVGGGWELPRH
jgi:hypothetical protein